MTGRRPRIVLTGGPGAGKTAVLEIVRRVFGSRLGLVPETASILFTGGFPRGPSTLARCAAQRAIFHVQMELEAVADEAPERAALVCDRGTLDSLAYWPRDHASFWSDVRSTRDEQLARYDAVVHLAPPSRNNGYERNAIRIESAEEAALIDASIAEAWAGHPRLHAVPSTSRFLDKVERVLAILREEIPDV
jgi:predicted ATPase